MHGSAGSILDISKYRDTCERSMPILHGIAILRYAEYRMWHTILVSYDSIPTKMVDIESLPKISISRY